MHTSSLLAFGQHPKEALNSLSKPEGLWWNFLCAHDGLETDIYFAWLCLKWRKAASTFLWTFFFNGVPVQRLIFILRDCVWSEERQHPHFCELFIFNSVPVQRSSSLSQFLTSSITSLCSLYYIQFAFFSHNLWWMLSQTARLRISQQSCWRLFWDALLCFWARDTASHFRKLESCYQFLILKFSVNSGSCFNVSTFLLCFSTVPQVLTVTLTSLTHSTALLNYLQDTKI
jgi:hypothetical protein